MIDFDVVVGVERTDPPATDIGTKVFEQGVTSSALPPDLDILRPSYIHHETMRKYSSKRRLVRHT